MLKFDTEAYFSLPTLKGKLTDGERFCAVGAFNQVMGFPQQYDELESLTDCPEFIGMVVRINDSIHPETAKKYLYFQLKKWGLLDE